MGEGGGFPQVRAVMSLMSPKSPVACPNTKGAQNNIKFWPSSHSH
jgi:hypothetical protein